VGVYSDIHGVFDAGHNYPLKALCDDLGEGQRPVVVSACRCGAFGDWSNRRCFLTCWNDCLREGDVEDIS